MYKLTDFSIISESAKAIQVQIVVKPSYTSRNIWLARSQIKFSGRDLYIPIWILSKHGWTPV
jgi:hypothetical protein